MVFNSGTYIFFLVITLAIYYSLSRLRNGLPYQNAFLLFASYFFYGWWDWIFLGLIFVSTIVDYVCARVIASTEGASRRIGLIVSIVINLGILGIFKYYDFFIGSLVDSVHAFAPGFFPQGKETLLLRVVLPVGISFYTFQTMSYTIDVYRRVIPAERNFLDFALFVCFFPQLVAGPIERAGDLLPQLKSARVLDMKMIERAGWLLLLGFFMKVYVADNLDPLVNKVFLPGREAYLRAPEMAGGHGAFQVLLACLAFAFQIYCDFAGYSSIALGSAALMGVRLSQNFNTPEFANNPSDLFKRWHITLSRWVMDYIYIPLGGSRMGALFKYRNLLITFLLMGLWHGANWTFVLWGLYLGIWLVLHDMLQTRLPAIPDLWPQYIRLPLKALKKGAVFSAFALTAVFFRAYDTDHSLLLLKSLVDGPYQLYGRVQGVEDAATYLRSLLAIILPIVLIDWMHYRKNSVFWIFSTTTRVRILIYLYMILAIVVSGVWGRDVIYFAF